MAVKKEHYRATVLGICKFN